MEFTTKSGQTFMTYSAPFLDDNGQKLALVVGLDITDQKHAEAALHEAKEATLKAQKLAEKHSERPRTLTAPKAGSWLI